MLIVLMPVSTSAGLFEAFSDVCLVPVLSEGSANVSGLKEIDPDKYGLKGGEYDYISAFATPVEDYYFRLVNLETFQCTAHHFDYANADLSFTAFDSIAQRFDLERRADCDLVADGGQQIIHYQLQQGYTVTTVWLNTDERARVTWMGLKHAKNGSDCN